MAVFEQKTPWKTRKDVKVDDIAPNIRHVHITGLHSITLTLPEEEAESFKEWLIGAGLPIQPNWSKVINGEVAQFIMMGLTENQVMLIKLAWSRYGMPA